MTDKLLFVKISTIYLQQMIGGGA